MVPGFQRYVNLIHNRLIYRVMLFLLGFFDIDGFPKKIPPMGSGHLILSPHTSPIDLLVLNYLASPIYAKVTSSVSDSKVTIQRSAYGLWKSMMNPKTFVIDEAKESKGTLKDLKEKAGNDKQGPIVLFFEVIL